jgi:hypothetical protein
MEMIADHKSKNDPSKGGYLPEKAPEKALNKEKGDQSKDDKIKEVHV